MNKLYLFLIFNLLCGSCLAGLPFAKWDNKRLILTNGIIERIIELPGLNDSCFTVEYKVLKGGTFKYFNKSCPEFQFIFNGKTYSGKQRWHFILVKTITDLKQGSGAAIVLKSTDGNLEVTLSYLLYPNSPTVRKNIAVKNLTKLIGKLESVDVEKFDLTAYYAPSFSWIMSDYGRKRSIGPFLGGIQDALVIVHNTEWNQGIVIGNEASGVMKRTSAFVDGLNITTGLTHLDEGFPFRKWLQADESFQSPQVFTMLYNDQHDPNEILNTVVPDFVRQYMGIRLSEFSEKPTFVYNTWSPFGKNINEKLIMELAKSAADAGMKEFIIDDGWQDNYGDWGVDKSKFPNGLEPVFAYVKSLGMKPGLWISIGTAAPSSKVFHLHPEWFVKNKAGKPYSLVIEDNDKYTACFGTGWKQYIQNVLIDLTLKYNLQYLKLDFSVVTSPYRYLNEESGCYATDHPGHRDHQESLFTNYEPMWQLFDDLHKRKPGLFIDCTFETLGALQAIDYSLLKHAEGDWISNYDQPEKDYDLQARYLAWWRSPAMSATALVIGNPKMDDKGWEMHIKSLAGALPIMLGDPRKLTDTSRQIYKSYAQWMIAMQRKYDIFSYRQDLPGFGQPSLGMWDGFQRINTENKSGGIVGVFRQGAVRASQLITVKYLDGQKVYNIKTVKGVTIRKMTGAELQYKGFDVTSNDLYDGQLFEVEAN